MNEELRLPETKSLTLSVSDELTNIAPMMAWADFQVRVEADVELAVAEMTVIKGHKKAMEAEFDRRWGAEKKVFKRMLDMIRDYERTMTSRFIDPPAAVSDTLRKRIETFWKLREERLEKEAREARDRALAEEKARLAVVTSTAVATGDDKAIEEMAQRQKNVAKLETRPVEVSQTVRTTAGTLAQTKIWKWRIVDEKLIPREFLVVDEKRLNAMAKEYAKTPNGHVPGVEFYQEIGSTLR